jgi:hypothetical protein
MLNPGDIGATDKKKEIAKPFAKVEAKIGKKYDEINKSQAPQS